MAPHARWAAAAVAAALALGGCTTFSADGGFDPVEKETRARLGKEVRWTRTDEEKAKSQAQVAALTAHVLVVEDAVQIALLNNRGLQAAFEELGISEADLVQSGRLANPRFTLRHAGAAAQYDIEETLSFNVLSLITAPITHDIGKRRFVRAQSAVVIAVVQLAYDTRRAFIAAVAARQSVRYLEQVESAAGAAAELARRMVLAGNWNPLDLARERVFSTEASQRLALAKAADVGAREKLLGLMGLSDAQPVELAQLLPDPPPSIEEPPDVETLVLQNRIDLRLERMQIDELARGLGLTRATRFVNVLDAGPTRVLQGAKSQPYEHGYEVSVEIPIFDGGGARVKRAQAVYEQAVDRFTQDAIDARSQIRRAYAAYRAAFDIARQQHDVVLPARKLMAEQNLLRYNASLISVFELLADARGQIEGAVDYLRSVGDFWTAKSRLDAALLGDFSP